MIKNLAYSLCCTAAIFSLTRAGAQITKLQDYQNFRSAAIGTFQGINFREGGFSGLYPIPNTSGKEFWTLSDRGVNVDAANANPTACRPTYDKIYSFPNYAPKIHRIRVNGDSIQILQSITMKRPNGTNATGIINPTGFGSTAAELASTDTVLNCSNFNSKIAAKDVWGIDGEGLVVDKQGNFWICEEGGASIWKLNAFGVVQKRYSPYANLPGAEPQDVLIDTVFKYRKNNRGFEGIAITPNGKIYAMIQSPVFYPNQSTGEGTRIHRILEIDPSNDSWKMYAYLNDGIIGASGSNQIRLKDWKIGDLAAVNNNEFLVLEAALRGTSDLRRVYKINISGATPVTSGLYNGKTLEAMVDAAGLTANGIVPVQKDLVIDLNANGWPASLEKAEGLAILDNNTVAIVNDNDYGQVSPLENGIATATGITSHLIKYGLNGANALSNFNFIGINLSQGRTAQNSNQSPYLTPSVPGVHFTSILTAGDVANNGYRMAGTPDGLGAFDNNDGTFTLLMNHEFGNTAGIVRAHGSKGTFVSKWIINKNDLSVVSGSDLVQNLKLWSAGTLSYNTFNSGNPYTTGLARFCSGDLPKPSAFYNAKTGKGTQNRIFMNGEENGTEGRAFAHIITGIEAGVSYELPRMGKFSIENSLANPATGDVTVVAGTDDATPGQVYFYIGTKTNTGNDIEKAGLTNGSLYAPVIAGFLTETDANYPAANTPFTMANLGNVQNMTGAQLETASNNAGVARFLRPEDGAWDPNNPSDFYFVTTNGFNNPSRLWKLHFSDINNMQAGGTVTVLLNGTQGQRMFDNITIDNSGHVLMVEDVGGNEHIGKVWQYTIGTGDLKIVAQHDSLRFKTGAPMFLTIDEEASGIVDVQSILGPGMFLVDVQAHYGISGELVEGGQLLAMYNPDTYNSNPEINLSGNNTSILNGDVTPDVSDNTLYANVNLGETVTKSFVIENKGTGNLLVSKIELNGASQFTLLNAPAVPFTIAPNSSQTIQVKFAPVNLGTYNTQLVVINNDFDEEVYAIAIQGTGYCAPFNSTIAVSPNPTVANQQANTIYLGYGPQSVNLQATGNSFAPYTYSWTPVNSTSQAVTVSPTTTTNYTANVWNAYGCPSSVSQQIAVIDIRDGNKNKVYICHNGKTNSISVNAVPAHLGHGDQLGDCDIYSRGVLVNVTEESLPVLYPNPASNEAIIVVTLKESDKVSVTVADANGKIVLPAVEENLKGGEQRISLNTASLKNGTYVVRVATKAGVTNVKLVVLH